jgi:hypothetical protein
MSPRLRLACRPGSLRRQPPSGGLWLHEIEHDGFPDEGRKATLAVIPAKAGPGEHIEGDGATVFQHACNLGLEGIVSKRKDSPYCLGRA